jgi:hypothetical protein
MGYRLMLPYHLPAWQHNSQTSQQKISHLKRASVMCSFLPLADDVLKMYYLGDGPEAGAQVLMWKAWQV